MWIKTIGDKVHICACGRFIEIDESDLKHWQDIRYDNGIFFINGKEVQSIHMEE